MFSRLSALAACLFILLAWSAGSSAASLKIGEINPLTGRLAKQGIEIHEGVMAAVAEANEAGGIDGRKVELVSRDDQSQPDVALARAEELCAKEKVLALTGGYVDSLVGPISQVARKYQIPYVASASLQKELVRRDNSYFFRVSNLEGFVAPLCAFVAKVLKPQRLALLHATTPGSTEFAMDLEQCLRSRGVSPVLKEKFRPGTADFVPLIAKLRSLQVDVVVSGGFTPDHMLMLRQLKENHVCPQAYIGPFGIAYESFIQETGPDANYLFSTCAWSPGITMPGTEAESEAFVRRFQRLFQREPNTTNMHGYTSARAVLAAMRKVVRSGRPLTGPNIRQALAGLDLLLPMERLVFDERGDPRFYRHVVVQIQNGDLRVVYPPEKAAAAPIYPMPSWDQRK